MVNNGGYNRLSSDLPSAPPDYEDLESNLADVSESPLQIEEFEIEDEFQDPIQKEGFLIRASLMTKKFAANFNNKVVRPVTRMIDPMYEAYKYFSMQYEQSILKMGNPLVVKRLLYVFFITGLIFLMSRLNSDYGVNGASGGTFTSGKFYDVDLLGETIPDMIDLKQMKENLEYFSSMPHISGTKGDLALAKYIQNYMVNNGVNSLDFNELKSYINYPILNEETFVKLSDGSYKATLYELDNNKMEYLAYNPNSLNTNTPLEQNYLYLNYGNPEDFLKLKNNNIKLDGSILLIKYGGSIPESNKVNIAQNYGAKAVIFITPEFELGSSDNKKTFDNIIQKQNVGFTRISSGDVLTPASSSGDGFTTRVPWFKSDLTPKIPTIPVSWKDGEYFIKKLDGKGIKIDGDSYSGDSNSEDKITLNINTEERSTQEIWNVVGSIPGREQGEEGIIIGASRDASCYGTLSSNTGTIVLLELMKIFTSLQRKFNWSPSRSIYFVSFDATQYNLAGSSEWIQARIDLLKNNGFAYIDLSDAVTGDILSINSNPFFHDLIKDALKKIKVGNDKSLYDTYKSQAGGDVIGNNMVEMKNYIPFINLANIPSLEIKFTGNTYPEGSCYDNFENFEKLEIDISMEKHKQLVHLLALISLNLAEQPLIPYNFVNFADSFLAYAEDLENYTNEMTKDISHKPSLSFDPLKKSLEILKSAGEAHRDWANNWKEFIKTSPEPSLLAMERWKINQRMIEFNAFFLIKNLNPKRPGYLNVLLGTPYWAPSSLSGNHVWNSFPELRDLIYDRKFDALQHDIGQLSDLITYASDNFLDSRN